MKTVVLTKPYDLLHVETPLGIVNIRIGLSDNKGRNVDSIEVIPHPDPYSGKKVKRSGYGNTRLIELKGVKA